MFSDACKVARTSKQVKAGKIMSSIRASDTELNDWITIYNRCALPSFGKLSDSAYVDIVDADSGEVLDRYSIAATEGSGMTAEGHKDVMSKRGYVKIVVAPMDDSCTDELEESVAVEDEVMS